MVALLLAAIALPVLAATTNTYYTLTANTSYSITATTGRNRIIIQNCSTSESIWVAPGEASATVSQSIRILPLGRFSADYDDTVPVAVIASTAQSIAITQKTE